jgi:hypothetical protein
VIGLTNAAILAAVKALSPLFERDPEVYRSRMVRRWTKRYVALMLQAKKETDYDKKTNLIARAGAARAAVIELGVAQKTIDELDLVVNFGDFKDFLNGKSE